MSEYTPSHYFMQLGSKGKPGLYYHHLLKKGTVMNYKQRLLSGSVTPLRWWHAQEMSIAIITACCWSGLIKTG